MGNYRVQNITTVEKTEEKAFSTVTNPDSASTITANSHLTTFVIERPSNNLNTIDSSTLIEPGDLKQIRLDDLFGEILTRLKTIEDKIDNLQKHLGPLGEIGNNITVITE